MNTAKIATALNTISVAFGELAEALSEGETPSHAQTATAPVLVAPSALPVAADDDFPPFAPNDYEAVPLPAETPGLGRCPTHGSAWSVKSGGVSKAGKAYSAFWKCDGKTDGVYCDKKPTRAWADAHPIAS